MVETEETYPQPLLIQLTQDKCSLADNLQAGQQVEVDINLRGREWTNQQGKIQYFVSLEAWRITPLIQNSVPIQQVAGNNEPPF